MKLDSILKEPYRLFFPLGIGFLLWGLLVWVPLIWNPGVYPVNLHRYLMLNGFVASFVGGFLMTAVPRFSQTQNARLFEVVIFVLVTLIGIPLAMNDEVKGIFFISSLQPVIILFFMVSRILKRKNNPPYSFVFIFVGLILWIVSGILSITVNDELFKSLHYEGAIAAIIIGVGTRLIPGILGHTEILRPSQKIPLHFVLLMLAFVASYFLADETGAILRGVVVAIIAFYHWKLFVFPKDKTKLTWSIWLASWLIVLSFLLKAFWIDGMIHASHAFFINGIVLMSLLIATRVIQSHGPGRKELENKKSLLVISFMVFFASLTRISAFLMPESYLTHLSYSALVLICAVIFWSFLYLRYVFQVPAVTSK